MICMWCGKANASNYNSQGVEFKGGNFPVCCNECKENFENTNSKKIKNRKPYFFLLIANIAIFLVLTIISGAYGILYLTISMGLTIIFYPSTTPEVVKSYGLEKSMRIAKGIGIGLIIIGIIFYTASVLI